MYGEFFLNNGQRQVNLNVHCTVSQDYFQAPYFFHQSIWPPYSRRKGFEKLCTMSVFYFKLTPEIFLRKNTVLGC